MNRLQRIGGGLLAATLAACAGVTPAPGSAEVRMTTVPADVQSCKAVGNVGLERGNLEWEAMLRNKTVGYGGDTLLMTEPLVGIAYRCAKE
jgi:hypothetical protein